MRRESGVRSNRTNDNTCTINSKQKGVMDTTIDEYLLERKIKDYGHHAKAFSALSTLINVIEKRDRKGRTDQSKIYMEVRNIILQQQKELLKDILSHRG